ncbi:MAG: hypothetical protein IT440_15725 [Phycisphaeraceae bacterium]|nr:hypothetical protein [Phycisphaeraceae bacterium]
MSDNGVVKKDEPVIGSRFIPLGVMLPEQKQDEVKEVETSGNGHLVFFALLVVAAIWFITVGW